MASDGNYLAEHFPVQVDCSNAIAEDFGIERWWKEQEYVTAAREANYI